MIGHFWNEKSLRRREFRAKRTNNRQACFYTFWNYSENQRCYNIPEMDTPTYKPKCRILFMKGYAKILDKLLGYAAKNTKHPMKIYVESDMEVYILIQAPRPMVINNLLLKYYQGAIRIEFINQRSPKQSWIKNIENYGKYDMKWENSFTRPITFYGRIAFEMHSLVHYRLEVVALNSKSHMNYLTFGKTGDLFIGLLGEPLNVTFLL